MAEAIIENAHFHLNGDTMPRRRRTGTLVTKAWPVEKPTTGLPKPGSCMDALRGLGRRVRNVRSRAKRAAQHYERAGMNCQDELRATYT